MYMNDMNKKIQFFTNKDFKQIPDNCVIYTIFGVSQQDILEMRYKMGYFYYGDIEWITDYVVVMEDLSKNEVMFRETLKELLRQMDETMKNKKWKK